MSNSNAKTDTEALRIIATSETAQDVAAQWRASQNRKPENFEAARNRAKASLAAHFNKSN